MAISAKPTFHLFPLTFCIWHCSAWLERLRLRDKENFVAIYIAQEVSGLFVNTHLQKSILGQDPSADILSVSPDGSVKWILKCCELASIKLWQLLPPEGLSPADFSSSWKMTLQPCWGLWFGSLPLSAFWLRMAPLLPPGLAWCSERQLLAEHPLSASLSCFELGVWRIWGLFRYQFLWKTFFPIPIDQGHQLLSSWFELIKTGSLTTAKTVKIMLCPRSFWSPL